MAAEWNTIRADHHGRMHDLSVFMKVLKQRFTIWHNSQHDTLGTLWTERFSSLLVESNDHTPSTALRIVAAFIEMDPVRCGAVEEANDYPFSGRWTAQQQLISPAEITSIQAPPSTLPSGWTRSWAFGSLEFILAIAGKISAFQRQARAAFAICPSSDLYAGRRFRSD
jgi:hypothetical protein